MLPALPNSASVASTTTDPDTSDNTSTIATTVVTQADLSITLASDKDV